MNWLKRSLLSFTGYRGMTLLSGMPILIPSCLSPAVISFVLRQLLSVCATEEQTVEQTFEQTSGNKRSNTLRACHEVENVVENSPSIL